MPKGYTGRHAERYFELVEDALREAHSVIKSAPTHISGVNLARMLEPPYTRAEALYRGGSVFGFGTSANIVVDETSLS